MDLFETTIALDDATEKAFHNETKKTLNRYDRLLLLGAIVAILSFGFAWLFSITWLMWPSAIVALCLYIVDGKVRSRYSFYMLKYLRLVINEVTINNVHRLQGALHGADIVITTSLSKCGFQIKSLQRDAVVIVPFTNIYRIIETETFYLLCAEIKQKELLKGILGRYRHIPCLMKKADIDAAGKRDTLIDFLAQHCKNAKWNTK